MPTPHQTPASPSPPEDDLDELPPLDGEGDGEEAEGAVPDLEESELLAEDTDPFDDTTGDKDPVPDLETVDAEGGWMVDDASEPSLDVGSDDIIGASDEAGAGKSLLLDNDEPGVEEEDFELDDQASSAHDAGEEGPMAEDEALREEDLPALDADEDGEAEDESFFDRDVLPGELPGGEHPETPAAAVGLLPEWSKRAWDAAFGRPPTGAVHALACATRGVLTGGRQVAAVDLEGAVTTLAARGLSGGEVTALCFDGALLVAATERGGVFVSRDGGQEFTPANTWRERVSAHEAASGLDLALGAGTLWGRTAQGKLLLSTDQGTSWEIADVDGFVLAIAVCDRGHLVAIASALGGIEVLRGAPGALEVTRVPEAIREARPGVSADVAARGSAVAFAVGGAAVRVSLDGHAWSSAHGTQGAAAITFVDAAGTLLSAVVAASDLDDTDLWLVSAPAGGDALVVARVDADPVAEPGPIVLAWDEAHGVAWVGGAFGVSAFQPSILV